jgi:hypothetical protein
VLRILGATTDPDTGALAWGATRVNITYTGKRSRVPKFEGTVEARAIEGVPVVRVTRGS